MSTQGFIFAFFLLTIMLLGTKFQSSMMDYRQQGSDNPVMDSVVTIAITVIFMTFISLILSFSLDLVYSMWTDKMLAVSMVIFTFAIIPASFNLAKGIR